MTRFTIEQSYYLYHNRTYYIPKYIKQRISTSQGLQYGGSHSHQLHWKLHHVVVVNKIRANSWALCLYCQQLMRSWISRP